MKLVTSSLLDSLTNEAIQSQRKRAHYNLHPNLEDKIHRLCIAVEPGSYVKPHRHLTPEKWELLVILRGKMKILLFDDEGIVIDRVELKHDGENICIEIPAGVWHTFVSMESGSVVLESKPGPYSKPIENDFVNWAPNEGEAKVELFEKWYRMASAGDIPKVF